MMERRPMDLADRSCADRVLRHGHCGDVGDRLGREMTDLVDYLRDKLEAAKAEDAVTHVRVNGWCDRCGGLGSPGIQHQDVPSTATALALTLTADERRSLAFHALQRAAQEEDVRYWHPDPAERARLPARWRSIAGQLHPDPWKAS